MPAEDRQPVYGVQRFKRALVMFLGGRAVQAFARALLVLLLVRVLSVEDFGAYMLIVGLAEATLQFASFGILPIGYRYLPELTTTVSGKRIFGFVAALTAVQFVAVGVVAAVLAVFWVRLMPTFGFSAEQIEATWIACLLFLVIPAFRYTVGMLDSLLEQGRAQVARALMPAGRAALICALLLYGTGVDLWTVVVVDVVVSTVSLLLGWLLLFRSLRGVGNPASDQRLPVREMVRFGWHMAGTDLAGATGSPGALRAVLANALGVAEAGLFAFLQSLQRLVGRYLPGVLLRGLIRPVLVNRSLRANGIATLSAGSGLLFKANAIGVLAGCIVIATAGNEVIQLLSGGKFADAGPLLLLVFIGLGAISQRAVIEMIMQITGHTVALRATAMLSPLALLIVWLAADQGLALAISVVVAGSFLSAGVAMAVITARTNVQIDYRGLGWIFALGTTAAVLGSATAAWMPPLVAAAVVLALYALVLWRLRPFTGTEIRLVEKVFGRNLAALVQRPVGGA